MKKLILLVALFFLSTSLKAQKTFYEAIEANGESATYEGFSGLTANGDGTFKFLNAKPTIKLKIEKLLTGQPVGFTAKPVTKSYGGFGESELSDYGRVDSYPNVMSIKHTYTKDGYMMIDDLLLVVNEIPNKSTPKLENVSAVYVMVKERGETKGKKKKKKKGGFLSRMKSKVRIAASKPKSPTYKYLLTLNIEEKFNTYVSEMKLKQMKLLTSKDRSDIAKIKRAREAGDEEIKRYNDSIKATPEYKDLQRRKRQNELNYQSAQKRNVVTLRNNSQRTIYVGTSHSVNRGTEIPAGRSAKWNCSQDAYLQNKTVEGGSNAYRSTNTKVYSENSGCGKIISIN